MNRKINIQTLVLFLIFLITSSLIQAQIPGQAPPVKTQIIAPPSRIPSQSENVNIGAAPFQLGEAVQVLKYGTWHPARVIRVSQKKPVVKIRYDFYNIGKDEWVGAERIRK